MKVLVAQIDILENDDAFFVLELSRPVGNGFGISIDPVPRSRIYARIQTSGDT